MPTTRSGCSQTLGDLRDRDPGRVRGEDRPGDDRLLELAGRPRASARASRGPPRSRNRRPRARRRDRSRSEASRRPPVRRRAARARRAASSAPAFARSSASALTSYSAVSIPARASTAPIPGPIVPVPITAARLTGCHVPSCLQFLDAPPDPLGRQRQLVHRHARVGERVDDRGGYRGQRALAAALRAVRAGAVAVLDDHARHLARAGPRSSARGSRAACRSGAARPRRPSPRRARCRCPAASRPRPAARRAAG